VQSDRPPQGDADDQGQQKSEHSEVTSRLAGGMAITPAWYGEYLKEEQAGGLSPPSLFTGSISSADGGPHSTIPVPSVPSPGATRHARRH
jgi:hypothetical protein